MAKTNKNIAGIVLGITAGAVAAAASCLAVFKIFKEIKKSSQWNITKSASGLITLM